MSQTWPWAAEFDADGTYLNSATMGLPPRVTTDAVHAALEEWRRGVAHAPGYDDVIDRARAAYGRLVGVPTESVAVGHQVSPFVSLLATAVPDGATVLVPTGEFTSVTFPFATQAHRGVRVLEVPLTELADHIDGDTGLVALAAVQSADGSLAPLDAVARAADHHGVDVLVDLTQAAGWLVVDATRFAYTVCSAYKWLLSPRGTAFLTVAPGKVDALVPTSAGWYAGSERWSSIYGLPLRLADGARRFDVSPGWHAWVGTEASLDFLESVGAQALQDHALELEEVFAAEAGLAATGGAIRSLLADAGVPALLAEHGVRAAERAGRLRVSFHVNNTAEEVARVGRLLRGHVST